MSVALDEVQVATLSDGRRYRLVWAGLLGETSPSIITRTKKGTLTAAFMCRRCKKTFVVGDPYYNRKGRSMNRKSSYYCLVCAEILGLIEAVKPSG